MQPAFLVKNRHGTFYFRAVIPKQLRHHFPKNKREVKKSLQTDSKRIAIVRARALRVRFDRLIHKLMKNKWKDGPENPEIDDDGFFDLEWVKFCEIEMDGEKPKSIKGLEFKLENEHEAAFVRDIAGLSSNTHQADAVPAVNKPTTPLLSAATAEYCKKKIAFGCWKPRTAAQMETSLRDFLLIVGDILLEEITKLTIADYRKTLAKLPANRNKLKQYRGKTIPKVLALQDVPPMDTTTLKNNLGRVSTFLAWCVEGRGYIENNPAEDARLCIEAEGSRQRSTVPGAWKGQGRLRCKSVKVVC